MSCITSKPHSCTAAVLPVTSERISSDGSIALRVRKYIGTVGLPLIGIALVFVLWQVAALTMRSSQVPSPLDTLIAIPRDWQQIPAIAYFTFAESGLADALVYTTVNVVVGVAIGSLAGVLVGIVMAYARLARAVLEPIVLVLGTIPLVVILPFLMIWFGTDRFAQSGLVILSAFVTTAITAQSAAMTVGRVYADYARSLGATPLRILSSVTLPAVVPQLVGAVRLSLAAGWGWQAVAELLGGSAGIGQLIRLTANTGAVDSIFATILCITVIALIVDAIVLLLGRAITRWA